MFARLTERFEIGMLQMPDARPAKGWTYYSLSMHISPKLNGVRDPRNAADVIYPVSKVVNLQDGVQGVGTTPLEIMSFSD